MPIVTWVKPETNIQRDEELFELLNEINSRCANELFIEHKVMKKANTLFRKPKNIEWYTLHWDIGNGEYQLILGLESLDRQDILCYLLGILTGLDKCNFS